jgi:glucose-6-phosphate dehydrogenase assembly protein OpcA
VAGAVISAPPRNPTAALLGGWLSARLGARIEHVEDPTTDVVNRVQLRLTNGETLDIVRHDATATLSRAGFPDRILPLVRRPLGEELAEELRRLDPDQPYAQALAAATGSTGLESRPATRVHVWHDPTLAERPDEANAAGADEGARGGGATAALGEATVVEATR